MEVWSTWDVLRHADDAEGSASPKRLGIRITCSLDHQFARAIDYLTSIPRPAALSKLHAVGTVFIDAALPGNPFDITQGRAWRRH